MNLSQKNILGALAASFLIVAAVILVLGSGCSSVPSMENKVKTVPVKVQQVMAEDVTIPFGTVGRLHATSEMNLSFKTGGIVERFLVDEGHAVKKGQVLARLKLDEINSRVAQAESGYEKAERDYRRANNLYADSVVTLSQLEDAQTGLEIAEANLKLARFNEEHSVITAPADGVILHRHVEANELVSSGRPVISLGASGGDWIVRAGVSDRHIVKLGLGDTAWVRFDAYPGRQIKGAISELAEAADPYTHTYEIELRLEPTDFKLVSGFVARIELFPRQTERLWIAPASAIIDGDGNAGFVYVVDSNNLVDRRQVEIRHVLADGLALSGGLEQGEIIVSDGAAYLRQGTLVDIRN